MSKTHDLFERRHLTLVASDALPEADLIAGQSDVGIKTSPRARYAALRNRLGPRSDETVWLTSELHRAKQTAARLYPDVTWTDDPFLTDRSAGRWEGLTWQQVREQDPIACEAYWNALGRSCAPGGETLHEVKHRVAHFLSSVANQAGYDRVVAVTHPDVLRVTIAHIMNGPMSHAFRVEIAPLATLQLVGGWSGWRIHALHQS